MPRGLIRRFVIVLVAAQVIAAHGGLLLAASDTDPVVPTVLQRFLSLDDPSPNDYRALRHLDAHNERFNLTAWMDVWTEADNAGRLTYKVVGEGGSGYIRSHVFIASLETEKKMYQSGQPERAALTLDNYTFEERPPADDGLSALAVKPRRKDVLLIDGLIFLRPEDGELMRIEGRLSKAPSFWTRQVHIVRWYQRIAGVRMPVALESVVNIRLGGPSTFHMTYDYETLNGQRVGNPEPRRAPTGPQPRNR